MKPLFNALSQPEYVHVLRNPLPVYGLAVGVLGLTLAMALRSRSAQVVALIIILVCAASAWPVYQYGGEAIIGSARWQTLTARRG